MKLDGICIETDDAPRLAAFYKLFLKEEPFVEGSHYGFGQIAVYDPGGVTVAKEKNIWLTFAVADVDAEYQRLLREIPDIEIVSPPERKSWGAYSFWFVDPDGNKISVFQQQSET